MRGSSSTTRMVGGGASAATASMETLPSALPLAVRPRPRCRTGNSHYIRRRVCTSIQDAAGPDRVGHSSPGTLAARPALPSRRPALIVLGRCELRAHDGLSAIQQCILQPLAVLG